MKQRAPFFARPAASRKPAMKHTRLIALLAAACLLPALAGCAAEPAAPSSAEDAPEDSTPSTVDFRLTSGHHTAGVDFPAGTYDLTAIEWCGRVVSSNGAVDTAMGVPEYNTDGQDLYTQSLEDVSLKKGTVLSLSGGVILRLHSDDADSSPLQPREQDITEDVTLSAGLYTAGVDFPAGVYDFTATDGVGNVESSNSHSGGISDVMGTTWRIAEGFGFCEQKYQNVELPEGTTLSASGVTLLLQPSA